MPKINCPLWSKKVRCFIVETPICHIVPNPFSGGGCTRPKSCGQKIDGFVETWISLIRGARPDPITQRANATDGPRNLNTMVLQSELWPAFCFWHLWTFAGSLWWDAELLNTATINHPAPMRNCLCRKKGDRAYHSVVPCTQFEIPSEDFWAWKSRIRYRFVIHAEIPGSGIRN